jgi:hypothetical protein
MDVSYLMTGFSEYSVKLWILPESYFVNKQEVWETVYDTCILSNVFKLYGQANKSYCLGNTFCDQFSVHDFH